MIAHQPNEANAIRFLGDMEALMISIRPHSTAHRNLDHVDQADHFAPRTPARARTDHADLVERAHRFDRVLPSGRAPGAVVTPRHPGRDGLAIGILVAVVTWTWVALVDLAVGQPLRTFSVFGGLLPFSVAHVILCLAYGTGLVSIIHGATHEPGLILAAVFGSLLLQVAFAMVTVALSASPLGGLAWLRIFGGSLLGTAVAFGLLGRWYPIVALLRHAQEEG